MSEKNIIGYVPKLDNYMNLTPFTVTLIQNFPFLSDDFDSLGMVGYLNKVIEYLNKVIANENIVNTNVQKLYDAFVDLRNYVENYFDNLDIQEELANKLDDMVQDGTLQQIMNSFLTNSIITFNTVEDMVESTFLLDNSNCRTIGYYSVGDNGGALYHIVSQNPNIEGQIELDNGLYAYLIIENETINVKQFGAKGDGTTVETSILQTALNYGAKNVIFDKGTYIINSCLYPKGNVFGINKDETIIKFPNQNPLIEPILTNSILFFLEINDFEVKNICLEGSYNTGDTSGGSAHCITLRHCENVSIHDVYFKNPEGDGVYIGGGRQGESDAGQSKLIDIYNNKFQNVKRCAVSFIHCDIVNVHDNTIYKPHVQVGVFDIEPNDSRQEATNIKIVSNYCETAGAFVKSYYSQNNLNNPKYLLIKDNVVTCSIFYFGNNDENVQPFFDELYVINNIVTDSSESFYCGLKKAFIKNNRFSHQLRFAVCTNIDIINNILRDIVLVSSCEDFLIAENTMKRNQYGVANVCINITAGNNVIIKNNYISKVRNAIKFQLAENIGNIIIENNYIVTSKWGIYLYSSSYTYGNIKINSNTIIHDVQEDSASDVTFVAYFDQLTNQLPKNNYFDYNAIGSTKLNKVARTGEYLQNTNIEIRGTAPNQYYIKGWLCIDGENGTWIEDRIDANHVG